MTFSSIPVVLRTALLLFGLAVACEAIDCNRCEDMLYLPDPSDGCKCKKFQYFQIRNLHNLKYLPHMGPDGVVGRILYWSTVPEYVRVYKDGGSYRITDRDLGDHFIAGRQTGVNYMTPDRFSSCACSISWSMRWVTADPTDHSRYIYQGSYYLYDGGNSYVAAFPTAWGGSYYTKAPWLFEASEYTDQIAPVVSLNGSTSIVLEKGTPYVELGYSAEDDFDGSTAVTVTGSVDHNTVGVYTLVYSSVDTVGNVATAERTVEMKCRRCSLAYQYPRDYDCECVNYDLVALRSDNWNQYIANATTNLAEEPVLLKLNKIAGTTYSISDQRTSSVIGRSSNNINWGSTVFSFGISFVVGSDPFDFRLYFKGGSYWLQADDPYGYPQVRAQPYGGNYMAQSRWHVEPFDCSVCEEEIAQLYKTLMCEEVPRAGVGDASLRFKGWVSQCCQPFQPNQVASTLVAVEQEIRADQGYISRHTCEGCQAETCVCRPGYDILTGCTTVSCDPGYFKPSINEDCTKCPKGSFQDESSQWDCKVCAATSFTDVEGKDTCTPVPDGYYGVDTSPEGGFRSYESCSQGHFCTDGAETTCDTGRYQNERAMSECKQCVAGFMQDEMGKSECDACLPGKYQTERGSSSCSDVLPGYATNSNHNQLYDCLLGQYCPGGASPLAVCPGGQFQDETHQSACKLCNKGFYQDETERTDCKGCGVGLYQDEESKPGCKAIPPGYVGDDGTVLNQENKKIVACNRGFYCEGGVNDPKQCPVGTAVDIIGQSVCPGCPSDKFQDERAQQVCKTIDPGLYGVGNDTPSGVGYTFSEDCPRGHRCPGGSSQPVPCTVGQFQDERGLTDCKACLASEYQDEEGQGSCIALTECGGTREAAPPTISSDRVCLLFDREPEWSQSVYHFSLSKASPAGSIVKQMFAQYATAYVVVNDNRFSITSDGVLSTTAEFSTLDPISMKVRAIGDQDTCYLEDTSSYPGGCVTEIDVVVYPVEFDACVADKRLYVPFGTDQVAVSFLVPNHNLKNVEAFTDIATHFHVDDREVHPGSMFALGMHTVNASLRGLDGNTAVTCTFDVEVVTGFATKVTKTGHLFTPRATVDFLVDSENAFGGSPVTLPFQGVVYGKKLSVGVEAPETQPFTYVAPGNASSQFNIYLQWCSEGTMDESTPLLPATTKVTLQGLEPAGVVAFTSHPLSGITSDARCFRIAATSSEMTQSFTFTHIHIEWVHTAPAIERRQAIAPRAYFDVPTSTVSVTHTNSGDDWSADASTFFTVVDTTPPVFVTCPDNINVTLPAASESVNVTWPSPEAYDILGIASIVGTHASGSSFDVFNTPHNVVYTAMDVNGLEAHCRFQVHVIFQPQTLTVNAGINDTVIGGSTYSNALVGIKTASQHVSYVGNSVLKSFTADIGAYSRFVFSVNAPMGERVVFRKLDVESRGFLELDLQFSSENTHNLAAADIQDRAVSSLKLVGLSNENGTVPLTLPEDFFTVSTIIIHDGYIRIHGRSGGFPSGLSFSSLELAVDVPGGVASTGPRTYNALSTSHVSFSHQIVDILDTGVNPADYLGFLVILDTEPPQFANCPSNMTVSPLIGEGSADASWAEPTVSDNRGVVSKTLRPSSGRFDITLPGSAHPILYEAQDRFGNVGTCLFYIHVEDNEDPTITCDTTSEYDMVKDSDTANITFSPLFSDNSGWVQLMPVEPVYGLGEHNVTFRVVDGSGNSASCTSSFTVIDNQDPKFVNCPTAGFSVTTLDEKAVTAIWDAPDATDNVGVAGVQGSHQPGSSLFKVGETPVTYKASDQSGNNATCVFNVKVQSSTVVEGSSDQQIAGSSDSTSIYAIAGGVAGGFLILVVIIAFVVIRRQRRRLHTPANLEKILAQMAIAGDNQEDTEINRPREIKRSYVTVLQDLGKGNFGLVSKGILKENGIGYIVAIKSLHEANSHAREELLTEACLMCQFSHEHVVGFVGIVTVGEPVMAILEFMENGELKSFLQRNETTERDRLRIAGDMCDGCAYLHSKGYVHRDIAARNVLLDSNFRAKIADFGLAREEDDSDYYRSNGGELPVRWTAPEALEHRKFNEATDVWSAGITLYEIWTRGALPYKGLKNQRVWVDVQAGYRLPRPENCREEIYSKMMECWDSDSHNRACFLDLTVFFRRELQEEKMRDFNKSEELLNPLPEDTGPHAYVDFCSGSKERPKSMLSNEVSNQYASGAESSYLEPVETDYVEPTVQVATPITPTEYEEPMPHGYDVASNIGERGYIDVDNVNDGEEPRPYDDLVYDGNGDDAQEPHAYDDLEEPKPYADLDDDHEEYIDTDFRLPGIAGDEREQDNMNEGIQYGFPDASPLSAIVDSSTVNAVVGASMYAISMEGTGDVVVNLSQNDKLGTKDRRSSQTIEASEGTSSL